MAYGDGSERIRQRAWQKYIEPKIRGGAERIEVAIKPLMKELEAEGFKANRPRQFCTALQKKEFLQEKNLVLDRVVGPPSGTSTTVVLHYRIDSGKEGRAAGQSGSPSAGDRRREAMEAFEQMRGLMKEAIDARGGAEAFIRWVRSDSDEDAA